MNFFLDTNIPYGYTVIHDKWHEKASEFVDNNKNPLFWSNNVEEEYSELFNQTLDEIDVFFKQVGDILRNYNGNFLNYYDFERYVLLKTNSCDLDKYKKIKILEHFWNKTNIIEGKPEIINIKLEKFTTSFDAMYFKRDKKLKNTLILHNCGLNNYKRYSKFRNILKSWGVHKSDSKIVIDAHDCGLKHGDVIFVSADTDLNEKIIEHNPSLFKIIEFRSFN